MNSWRARRRTGASGGNVNPDRRPGAHCRRRGSNSRLHNRGTQRYCTDTRRLGRISHDRRNWLNLGPAANRCRDDPARRHKPRVDTGLCCAVRTCRSGFRQFPSKPRATGSRRGGFPFVPVSRCAASSPRFGTVFPCFTLEQEPHGNLPFCTVSHRVPSCREPKNGPIELSCRPKVRRGVHSPDR